MAGKDAQWMSGSTGLPSPTISAETLASLKELNSRRPVKAIYDGRASAPPPDVMIHSTANASSATSSARPGPSIIGLTKDTDVTKCMVALEVLELIASRPDNMLEVATSVTERYDWSNCDHNTTARLARVILAIVKNESSRVERGQVPFRAKRQTPHEYLTPTKTNTGLKLDNEQVD